MSDGVSGAGGVSPENKHIYEQQFQRSVKIFEESLAGYNSKEANNFPQKKAEYKKAMDESLKVMDQLGPVLNKEIQKQKLEADYQNFTAQGDSASLSQVQKDIEGLKGG
jgi:hypothetical protein